MSRILYVATSDIHINAFHVPYLDWLAEKGHVVDLAAEKRGDQEFKSVDRHIWLPFPRSLGSTRHWKTYRALRALIEQGEYDLVHCHTPIPAALTRLAARRWRKGGGKVLYTAHGFHFYSGGPLFNWLTYYPAEMLLSRLTDGIVTINNEDYGYTKRKSFWSKSYLIPGIGVQDSKFGILTSDERAELRESLGYSTDDLLVLYIAEFIPRKNHQLLLSAFEEVVKSFEHAKLLLAGVGRDMEKIRAIVKRLGLEGRVEFLGFRKDVERFAAISDVGVSTSKHEGLGLGLLEQMMCGVPVVATQDKGHREFVETGINGYLIEQGEAKAFGDAIIRLLSDRERRAIMGAAARTKSEEFAIQQSLAVMARIYEEYLPS
jgi:glycosyltransferase EpsD